MLDAMPRRSLGSTDVDVSALGLGGGPLGDPRLSDADAAALIDRALDRGVTLFDAPRSYGEAGEGAIDWPGLAIRFAAHAPGVDAALIGTGRAAHLDAAVDAVLAGPLDAETVAALRARFEAVGPGWGGIV